MGLNRLWGPGHNGAGIAEEAARGGPPYPDRVETPGSPIILSGSGALWYNGAICKKGGSPMEDRHVIRMTRPADWPGNLWRGALPLGLSLIHI